MKHEIAERIINERYGDELYHYGILNMSWGVRNGPPYPLRGAGKKISAKLRSEKQKLIRKVKAKKTLKEQREAEDLYKKKALILASGNMDKIYKNRNLFTADEMEAAIRKNQMDVEAKYASKRKPKDPRRFDSAMEATAAIGKAASNLAPVLDLGLKMAGLSEKSKDIKAKDAERGAKEFDRRLAIIKDFNEDEALKLFNKTYKTDITKTAKKDKKFDQSVFNALSSVDPTAAARYMSEVLGGATIDITNSRGTFNKGVFDALAAIDPTAAAKYMSGMTSGIDVNYDADALSKYMEAIGKSKNKGNNNNSSNSGD